MKKTIFTLAAGIIVSFAATSHVNAQYNAKTTLTPDQAKAMAALDKPASGASAADNKSLVNIRAVKDFAKTFSSVKNENWVLANDGGFIAKFSQNGIKNRVDYDRKGRWVQTIRYYGEKNLPADVRHHIKSAYYDFTITQVEEIVLPDKIAYLVHMNDEKSWVNILYYDGEMRVLEEYSKK
jgi:hypothetical protein